MLIGCSTEVQKISVGEIKVAEVVRVGRKEEMKVIRE